jgi:hypothetical protein
MIIAASDTGLGGTADVVQAGLYDVGLDADLAHARGYRVPDVV